MHVLNLKYLDEYLIKKLMLIGTLLVFRCLIERKILFNVRCFTFFNRKCMSLIVTFCQVLGMIFVLIL